MFVHCLNIVCILYVSHLDVICILIISYCYLVCILFVFDLYLVSTACVYVLHVGRVLFRSDCYLLRRAPKAHDTSKLHSSQDSGTEEHLGLASKFHILKHVA